MGEIIRKAHLKLYAARELHRSDQGHSPEGYIHQGHRSMRRFELDVSLRLEPRILQLFLVSLPKDGLRLTQQIRHVMEGVILVGLNQVGPVLQWNKDLAKA